MLQKKQDEFDGRKTILSRSLEDFEHVEGVEELLDIPKVARGANAVRRGRFIEEGPAEGLSEGGAARDGVIPRVSSFLNPLIQTVAAQPRPKARNPREDT